MENKDYLELIERIDSLKATVTNALEKLHVADEPYQSENINELFTAMALAQPNLPSIVNNKVNPWFDSPYADIFQISSKIYPVLGKEGLSATQQTRLTMDGGTILYTRLCHASGQWIEARIRVIPPKNDIDSFRSTLNALRVTQLLGLLGIGIKDDPLDDDGEVAMVEARQGLAKAPSQKDIKAKKESSETITKEQREELEYELGEYTDLAEEILDRCHVRSFSDIPKSQFRNAVTFIRKNKAAREK